MLRTVRSKDRDGVRTASEGRSPGHIVEHEQVATLAPEFRFRVFERCVLGVTGFCCEADDHLSADAKPMQDGGLFPFPQAASSPIPEPKTAMGWPITASGIRDLLLRVSRDWPSVEAIAITENGAAFDDVPSEDGRILDHQRANYLTSHIAAVGEAVELGAPVVSYHAWSFLDNFEWAEGYSKRFGLVYVDYESQNRTPKLSAEVYRSLILAHASDSEAVQQPVG